MYLVSLGSAKNSKERDTALYLKNQKNRQTSSHNWFCNWFKKIREIAAENRSGGVEATLCSGSSLQNRASLGSAKNFPWKARRAPLHRWRNGGLYGGWQYIWRRRQRRRQPRNVSRSSSRILRPLASTIRSKMWCTLVASAFQAGRRGTSSMIIQ